MDEVEGGGGLGCKMEAPVRFTPSLPIQHSIMTNGEAGCQAVSQEAVRFFESMARQAGTILGNALHRSLPADQVRRSPATPSTCRRCAHLPVSLASSDSISPLRALGQRDSCYC